jgi:hypothetical protein
MSEQIEMKTVRSAIFVALKLAKFRPSRYTTEGDQICSEAADAVVNSFARAGWTVIKTQPYAGWGAANQLPHFGGPPKRCQNCDD